MSAKTNILTVRLMNRLSRAAFLGLSFLAGLSLLVSCAAPATTPSPATPTAPPPSSAATQPPATPSAPVSPKPATPKPEEILQSAFPMEITDHLGRKVTIKKQPEKIVSLAPSNTETIFAIGLGYKVMGRTDFCDYPASAKEKPSVGSYSKPSIEKIISMRPDLVLATRIHEKEVIPVLESMGITVVAFDPKTIEQVLDSITFLGQITGAYVEADKLVESLTARIDAVDAKVSAVTQQPRVFYVVWASPLMSAGKGTFQDDLIAKAGGDNIAKELDGWKTISLESVINANPQVLIGGDTLANGANYKFVATEARLEDSDARKSGRVYSVNSDVSSRPGPRIVDALEQFAKLINPDLFK